VNHYLQSIVANTVKVVGGNRLFSLVNVNFTIFDERTLVANLQDLVKEETHNDFP
jgi:hypothetical protein